ncbi:universal stress protein [Rhodopirellula bahusiensis]|uniref:universal stress protein n=1 Tax=Rhodopirellula bahusiensis TaxID=2014065 RepID=UPI0032672A4C
MRVLLANDASQHSRAAADYLLAFPFRKPIDLDVASVIAPPMMIDVGVGGMPMDLRGFIDEERQVALDRVEETANQLRDGARGKSLHSVSTHVPVGPPANELLNLADQTDCELIVIGAVGHSALDRVLLGSVSDYVATHGDVSTLVVRPRLCLKTGILFATLDLRRFLARTEWMNDGTATLSKRRSMGSCAGSGGSGTEGYGAQAEEPAE